MVGIASSSLSVPGQTNPLPYPPESGPLLMQETKKTYIELGKKGMI